MQYLIVLTLLFLLTATNLFAGSQISGGGTTSLSSSGIAMTNNSDAQNAFITLKNHGESSSLSDFASFSLGDVMSNSWAGNQIAFSNVTLTSFGAYFTHNGSISFNLSASSTNTVAIVVRRDPTCTDSLYGNLFQLLNTGNTNGVGATWQGGIGGGIGWVNIWGYSGASCYPSNQSGYTNLVDFSSPAGRGADAIYEMNREREILIVSCDGNGHITTWANGGFNSYYQNNPLNNFLLYPTNTLKKIVIGNAFSYGGLPSVFQNGSQGYIESVFVFNKYITSNLVSAIVDASDWVQPFTKRRLWIGDSLLASSEVSPSMNVANLVDSFAGFSDCLPLNFEQGGTHLADYYQYTNIINQFPPQGKVRKVELEIGAGINDMGGNGTSGLQCFNILTNTFWAYITDPRYNVDVWDVNQTATNSSIYPQTPNLLANENIYNQMVITNRQWFRYVYRRDALITQDMLDTNRVPQLSTDGVHFFNATNGQSAWEMVAGLALQQRDGTNPYIISGVTFANSNAYFGSFTGNGAGLTNLNSTLLTAGSNVTLSSTTNSGGQITYSVSSAGGGGGASTNLYVVDKNDLPFISNLAGAIGNGGYVSRVPGIDNGYAIFGVPIYQYNNFQHDANKFVNAALQSSAFTNFTSVFTVYSTNALNDPASNLQVTVLTNSLGGNGANGWVNIFNNSGIQTPAGTNCTQFAFNFNIPFSILTNAVAIEYDEILSGSAPAWIVTSEILTNSP